MRTTERYLYRHLATLRLISGVPVKYEYIYAAWQQASRWWHSLDQTGRAEFIRRCCVSICIQPSVEASRAYGCRRRVQQTSAPLVNITSTRHGKPNCTSPAGTLDRRRPIRHPTWGDLWRMTLGRMGTQHGCQRTTVYNRWSRLVQYHKLLHV